MRIVLIVAALTAAIMLGGCDWQALKTEAAQLRADIATVEAELQRAGPGSPEAAELAEQIAGLRAALGSLEERIVSAETEPEFWTAVVDGVGALVTQAVPSAAGPVGVIGAALASAIAIRERRRQEAIVRSIDAAKVGGQGVDGQSQIVIDADVLGRVQDAAGVRARVQQVRAKATV